MLMRERNLEPEVARQLARPQRYTSNRLLTEGEALLEDGDCEGAIRRLTEALRADPQNTAAYFHRGIAYYRLGQFDATISDCNNALEFGEEGAFLRLRGDALNRNKQHAEALEDLERATRIDPDFACGWALLAECRIELKDYDAALRDCNRALALDETLGRAWFERGKAYYHSDREEEAHADFERCVAAEGPSQECHYYFAWLAHDRNDTATALKECDAALALGSECMATRLLRADVLTETPGRRRESLDEIERLFEECPPEHLDIAWLTRGWINMAHGRYEEAVADCTRGLELLPCAKAYAQRGMANRELGRSQESLRDLNQAAKLEPRLAEVYQQRALTHDEMNNPRAAIADLTRVLALDPGNVDALFTRSLEFGFIGKIEAAYADMEAAFAKGPSPELIAMRAVLMVLEGHYEEAGSDFAAAQETDPPPARFLRLEAEFRAMYPDAAFRKPQHALTLARQALQIAGADDDPLEDWRCRATLADALAANGRFPDAVTAMEAVVAEQPASGEREKNLLRLSHYRKQQPFLDQELLPYQPRGLFARFFDWLRGKG